MLPNIEIKLPADNSDMQYGYEAEQNTVEFKETNTKVSIRLDLIDDAKYEPSTIRVCEDAVNKIKEALLPALLRLRA